MAGMIHVPALDESVYAAGGRGAWHVEGHKSKPPARVSRQALVSARACFAPAKWSVSVRPAAATLRIPAIDRLAQPHLGRLLRLFDGRYRAGRTDVDPWSPFGIWRRSSRSWKRPAGPLPTGKAVATIHSGEGIATYGLALNEVWRSYKDRSKT